MSFKYTFFFIVILSNILLAQIAPVILYVGEAKEIQTLSSDINKSKKLMLLDNDSYDTSISTIQTKIRTLVNQDKNISLVLRARGISGTLTTIAQGNLLPYYRTHIRGLILQDSPSLLLKSCSTKEANTTLPLWCKKIKTLSVKIQKKASFNEVANALSPALQMDWYYPKTFLIDSNNTTQHKAWITALEENDIAYISTTILHQSSLEKFLKSIPIYIPNNHLETPTYYGPILRFHVGKILYSPKKPISILKNISYGKEKQQTYDIYFETNSTNNPLFIYVHGGGWTKGDKGAYADFCKQYANKGYSVASLNYRLLNLPTVRMKEVIEDVALAITDVINQSATYHANSKKVVVMGESAGAQLLFMALSRLDKNRVNVAILNSITADLHKHPLKKQKKLSGIKDEKERKKWLTIYSPLSNLDTFYTPTLALHSINDKVVPPSHLENLDIQSVIHHKNITAFWVLNGAHPLSPTKKSMQPGYQDIERNIDVFIKKNI